MQQGGQKLRLGTRGSLLAIAQSRQIATQLMQLHPGLAIELITIKTTGDRIVDRPLHDVGGKGLFTKELEQALLGGSIDFAVHSFKDVPVTMPLVDQSDLIIAAVPRRADPRDVLICLSATQIKNLPLGARIGTGSLRRGCQLLEARPDFSIQSIRGNIDTRLKKLQAGEFDAIILASAGLVRAALFDQAIMFPLAVEEMLPSPGQGALALECRRDDQPTRDILWALNDAISQTCVTIEREVVRILEGDCTSPIGALAIVEQDQVRLRIAVGEAGGHPPVLRADIRGKLAESGAIASKACQTLALR